MNTGWIKLHRKITEWEWYDDPLVFKLFIHLLLTSNLTDKNWHGVQVNRGQIITSYPELAHQLTGKQQAKIGVQRVRTALDKLKSTGEITVKTTNRYTVITIQNYNSYQTTNTPDNSQLTGKQQATNKQLTTTKEDKKERKKENIAATAAPSMFNSKEYIKTLISDSKRHIHIIGLYFEFKGFEFPAKEAAQYSLKRELRAASGLKGYADEKINQTMEYVAGLVAKGKFEKWDLGTITKYINEL